MSKARELADLIAIGSSVEVADITDLTADVDELNKLDGLAATKAELNKVSGFTGSTADLNKLDGLTASQAEINKLNGLNTTTLELEKLFQLATTKTELGHLTGSTSSIQDQLTTNADSVATKITADVTGEFIADSYNETYATVTSTTGATSVDCHNGNTFMHTLTESTTFTFTNPPATGTAYSMSVEIIQDATASGFTVAWPTTVDWPSATPPTLTGEPSGVDVFVFTTRNGGTDWYGFTAGQGFA